MKEYKQIFNGKYDDKGAVQAIDMLNDKPLTKDYFKTRPDMKQRIEKAIKLIFSYLFILIIVNVISYC